MIGRKLAAGLCVGLLTVMVGCGSSDSTSETSVSSADSVAGDSPAVDFDDDDVMFAQMMIPHHEQAIEMADIALDPEVGASQSVRDLATRIKAAQDPEIDQMSALLSSWGQPLAIDSTIDHSTMMSGMLTLDELATLSQLRGAEFDQAWIEAMIAHHEGAIEMGNTVLEDGINPEIRALAEQIISSQSAEIEELRQLLA